jgi:HEAT repeat protein
MSRGYKVASSVVVGAALVALGWMGGARFGSPPAASTGASATSGLVAADRTRPPNQRPEKRMNLYPRSAPPRLAQTADSTNQTAVREPVDITAVEATLANITKTPGLESNLLPPSGELLFKLREAGQTGRTLLEQMLRSDDLRSKIVAAQLLGQLSDRLAVPALQEASTDPDPKVSAAASRSLALIDGPEAVDALRALAQGPQNSGVEVNALYGLCKAKDPEGLRLALAFIEDANKPASLRAILVGNLAMTQEPFILPIIDRATHLFPEHVALVSTAVEYYKSLGSPAARDRLALLATNAQIPPGAREAARAAVSSN